MGAAERMGLKKKSGRCPTAHFPDAGAVGAQPEIPAGHDHDGKTCVGAHDSIFRRDCELQEAQGSGPEILSVSAAFGIGAFHSIAFLADGASSKSHRLNESAGWR